MWAKKVAQFRKSGKTKEEWCKKKNITLCKFAYWLRQFPAETTATQWLPVEIKQEKNPTSSPISVKIGQATVEIHPGFDQDHLLAVLSTLTTL